MVEELEKEKKEWLEYLEKAREISGVDLERSYRLTFEEDKHPIKILGLGLYPRPRVINIHPRLLLAKL